MTTQIRSLLAVGSLVALMAASAVAEKKESNVPAALDFEMKKLNGADSSLADYQGKVILVVNVASKCGLTPQYDELQALHTKYGKQGLAVVGFPCNQFGKQEPGTADDIREFCTENYGVEFELFAKVDVNGPEACAFYKHLTGLNTKPEGAGKISWNFEKFLIGRNGEVVARYSPRTSPDDPAIVSAIEAELAKQ